MNDLSRIPQKPAKCRSNSDSEIVEKARKLGWNADEIADLHLIYGPALALEIGLSQPDTTGTGDAETEQ